MTKPSFAKWPNRFAGIASGLILLVGSSTLVGWARNITLLKTFLPGSPAMVISTASLFILAGLSLGALAGERSSFLSSPPGEKKNFILRRLAGFSAGIVVLFGLLRLAAYAMAWDLGLDQLGFSATSLQSSPVRMAPATALNFVLLGCALLLAGASRLPGTTQSLAVLGSLIGAVDLIHYLFGGQPLIRFGYMAPHTALLFLLLSAGVLCTRPETGLVGLLISDTAGGVIARRLVPAVVVVPIFFGWLGLHGQRAGWFGLEAGIAVLALAIGAVFGGLIWATAALLHRSDSQRKHAEGERETFVSLVEQTDDFISIGGLDGIVTYVNRAGCKLVGLDQAKAAGRPISDFHPAEWWFKLRDEIFPGVAQGGGGWLGEAQLRNFQTQQPIHVLMNIFGIRHPDTGQPLCFAAVMRDISERTQAESKLRAQLERLSLLQQITRAIAGRDDLGSIYQVVLRTLEEHLALDFGCICDYDTVLQSLAVAHVGIRSQALALELALTERAHIPIDANGLGRCVQGHLVYEPDIADVSTPFPQKLAAAGMRSLVIAPLLVESQVFGVFVAARRAPRSFSSGECEFLRQASEHVALAAHQAQLHAALQYAYDDLRHTQQAVMQQERLRALGQMASGIAHDINNAISPVTLYTEMLLEKEPNLSPQTRRYLETVQRAADDVAQTVARMREFSRQREPELTLAAVHMNHLVEQVIDLTRPRWNDIPQQRGIVIRVCTELAPDLPPVMGAESELREALTNLIFNAADAMPSGGTLTLRTRVADQSPGPAKSAPVRIVQVEVADTGVGMDEETRRRCLEPFFTTKGERGTGLGLAMVYGVAQRHSADLEIDSAVGRGTTIRMSLLASTAVAAESDSAERPPAPLSRLRILVVDDDPLLVNSLRDILEADGHFVVTANAGQAGIQAFLAAQDRRQVFDVVFTDLGMPHVDGRKVAAAIKGASPSTPVILLTGWGHRLVAERDVPLHVDYLLNKPPKLRELREALAFCSQLIRA